MINDYCAARAKVSIASYIMKIVIAMKIATPYKYVVYCNMEISACFL